MARIAVTPELFLREIGLDEHLLLTAASLVRVHGAPMLYITVEGFGVPPGDVECTVVVHERQRRSEIVVRR